MTLLFVQSFLLLRGYRTMAKDKVVLITGGCCRIGRRLALEAASLGFAVAVHYYTSRQQAEELCTEIETLGSKAYLVHGNLANPDEVGTLIPRAQKGGDLVALVNNASIFEDLTWDETSVDDWQRHMAINLQAPFFLSQAFARSLAPSGQGRIITLLDWRVSRPGADHLPYTISKSALAALTSSLAIAFAPHITVNALALGAILPPTGVQRQTNILNQVPMQRWGTVDEVAQAFALLLTGPAFITGETLYIDGGRHLI